MVATIQDSCFLRCLINGYKHSGWCEQVQLHEKSKKHCNSLKSKSSKSTFFSTASFLFISAGLQRKILSTEDQVEKSEIIWYLDIVDSNCLFSVANRDSSKYKDMFPDSEIAKS